MPGNSPNATLTLNFKPEILNSVRPQLKTVDPKTVNYYVTFCNLFQNARNQPLTLPNFKC